MKTDKNIRNSEFGITKYKGVKIYYIAESKDDSRMTRKKINKNKSEVTISAFRTGKLIITGGSNINYTLKAYNFICKIMDDNADLVFKDGKDQNLEIKKTKHYDKKNILIDIAIKNKKEYINEHKRKYFPCMIDMVQKIKFNQQINNHKSKFKYTLNLLKQIT